MKAITWITFCVVAVIWPDFTEGKGSTSSTIQNKNSIEISYVNELAYKLKTDLQDIPYLKLNQTVMNAIRERVYVAIVVDKKKPIFVNIFDIKSKNKDTDYSESSESSESDEE